MDKDELKRIRKRMGLTVREFSDLVGVARTTVIKWENGTHNVKAPIAKLIRTLAKQEKADVA